MSFTHGSLIRFAGAATALVFALTGCNGDDPVAPPPPIEEEASLYLVHGVAAADVESEVEGYPIDVLVGTTCVFTEVASGTVSAAVDVPEGTHNMEVREADADAPCTGTVIGTVASSQFDGGESYTVFVHLSTTSEVTVTRFTNDLSPTDGSRIVARHGAAFGPVDVLIDEEPAIQNLANAQQQSVNVAAGTYTIGVAPAGTTEVAFEQLATVAPNTVQFAHAVGVPETESFGVLILTITTN